MATLGVIGKSYLESIASQLQYKVNLRSNWFISVQIIGFYFYTIFDVVINAVVVWMRTYKVDPYASRETQEQIELYNINATRYMRINLSKSLTEVTIQLILNMCMMVMMFKHQRASSSN